MKITHKINHGWAPSASPLYTEPVGVRYQAEVDASVARMERAYRRAVKRLQYAERKLREAHQKADRQHRVTTLQQLVEQRRAELDDLGRMMTAYVREDGKARHRTGRDDHLEMGKYVRPPKKRAPTFPVKSVKPHRPR